MTSPRPHVLEPEPQRTVRDLSAAPAWVTGLLAGLQGTLLSVLVVLLPAIAAYVATSADPVNTGVAWTRAALIGGQVWLLAHGVPVVHETDTISLVPLGLTAVTLLALHDSARRSARPDRRALAAGVGVHVAAALVIAQAAETPLGARLVAAAGAALVAVTGLGSGLMRRQDAPSWSGLVAPVRARVPAAVWTGSRAAAVALGLLGVASTGLVAVWLSEGRDQMITIWRALDPDVAGAVVLGLGQAALVPNLVVWGLAFVAGPGFAIGTGSSFAPAGVVSAPLPAVPLLGALPQPAWTGGPWQALPALLVVAGALAGWWLHRELRRWAVEPSPAQVLVAGLAAGVAAGIGAGLLVALASGSVGPGRLAEVGAAPLGVGLWVAGGVALGALAVVLPADGDVRRLVARRTREAAAAVRDRAGGASG